MSQSEARNRKISKIPRIRNLDQSGDHRQLVSRKLYNRKLERMDRKSDRIGLKPRAGFFSKPTPAEKKVSILDESLKAEIEQLSSDSSDDSDSDMEHIWTIINNKGGGAMGDFPHLSESRFHSIGDETRKIIWEYIRDHPNIPIAFKQASHAYQKFFKASLNIASRNCHMGYTLWAESIRILFWIAYYLCFSWRFAIVNIYKYLLKSDEFLTLLYNDRDDNKQLQAEQPAPSSASSSVPTKGSNKKQANGQVQAAKQVEAAKKAAAAKQAVKTDNSPATKSNKTKDTKKKKKGMFDFPR